jgi:hypothetical protein
MTRRSLNADGTLALKSFSCFGENDAAKAFREEVAHINAHNRKARAKWNRLLLDEKMRRTAEFEVQEKARREEAAQRFAKLETWSRAHSVPDGEPSGAVPTFI